MAINVRYLREAWRNSALCNNYAPIFTAIINTFQTLPTAQSATWGSITGTLSNQEDLQNTLDAKQNTITSSTNLTVNSISAGGYKDSSGEHLLAEYNDTTEEWYLGNNDAPINATVASAFYVPQVDGSGAGDQAATKTYVDAHHDTTKQDTLTAGTGIDITNNVISATSSGVAWGNITGTLSDQTDLQNVITALTNRVTALENALQAFETGTTYNDINTNGFVYHS